MPDRPGVANAHCSAWSRALISGGARMRSTPPWWGSWQVGQNAPAGPQQGAAEGAGSGAWRADAGVQANRPSCEPAKLGKDSGDVQRWWPRGTAHALCPLPQTCMIRSHDREDGSATGRHSGAVPFPNASTRRALGWRVHPRRRDLRPQDGSSLQSAGLVSGNEGRLRLPPKAARTAGPPRTRTGPMHQSREAHRSARPHHSPEGPTQRAIRSDCGASVGLGRGWWAKQALQQPWVGGPGLQQDRAGHAAGGIPQGQGDHQHVVQRADDG